MTHNSTHDDHLLPADLRPTADALDRLAQAEADSAPADLIACIAAASTPSLRARAPRDAAESHRRRALPIRRFAMAAGVMIVATVGLTWLAMQPAAPTQQFAADDFADEFDLLLTLTADDGDLRSAVDLLFADTATLEAELNARFDAFMMLDEEGSL